MKAGAAPRWQALLARLNMGVVFGLFLFVGVALLALYAWDQRRESIKGIEEALTYRTDISTQTLRDSLDSHEHILNLIGRMLLARNVLEDPQDSYDFLNGISRAHEKVISFAIARPDGQVMVRSNVSRQAPLRQMLRSPDHREVFERALSSPHLQTGATYYQHDLGKWVVPILLALRDGGGEVVAVMIADFDLWDQERVWGALEDDDGITYSGRIVHESGHLQLLVDNMLDQDTKSYLYKTPLGPAWVALMDQVKPQGKGLYRSTGRLYDRPDAGRIETNIVAWEYVEDYGLFVATTALQSTVDALFLRKMTPVVLLFVLFVIAGYLFYRLALKSQRLNERKMLFLERHDELTGLANKAHFRDVVDQLAASLHGTEEIFRIVYADVAGFQDVNIQHGMGVGDACLQELGRRLESLAGEGDLVARIAGVEFAMLVTVSRPKGAFAVKVERLSEVLRAPVMTKGGAVTVNISLGVACFPADGVTSGELLKAATLAAAAGRSNRGGATYFDPRMNEAAHRRHAIAKAIPEALEKDGFSTAFQPKVRSRDGVCEGVEALLRWTDPNLGFVSPVEFIPIAEETGLIEALGGFVLNDAVQRMASLNREFGKNLKLSVNASAEQFKGGGFVKQVRAALSDHDFPAGNLTIEVTESLMIQEMDVVLTILEDLRAMGVGVSIDDFGTGYSSLAYINRLPFTELKIDRSFIIDMSERSEAVSLVRVILAMGRELGRVTVAEGVETEEHRTLLRDLGCDLLQGYYFSPPMSYRDLRAVLAGEGAEGRTYGI